MSMRKKKNKKSPLHIILPVSALLAVFFFVILFVYTCIGNQVQPKSISLPYNLIAVLKDRNTISLEWHWDGNPKKVSGFIVERKEEGTSEYSKQGETGDLFFEDNTLDGLRQRYVYRIFAYKDTLRSEYSNEAVVEVKLPDATAKPAIATPVGSIERVANVQPDVKKEIESITPSPLIAQPQTPSVVVHPTPTQAPVMEETPEPEPIPYTEVGKVWLVPDDFTANVSAQFRFELHANTGDQKLSSYAMEISYPDEIVSINTSIGTGGIAAGAEGFVSAVTIKESGKILVSGTTLEPVNPSENLHLLSFSLVANSPGISTIEVKVVSLKDANKRTIGYPRSVPGTLAITLARVIPNQKLYILNQVDVPTPNPGEIVVPTPNTTPYAGEEVTGIEPDAEPSPVSQTDYDTPEPEPDSTPYYELETTPYSDTMPTPYYEPEPTPFREREPYYEPEVTPYREQTPYYEPEVTPYPEPEPTPYFEPTIEPTPEPTQEPVYMLTPEPTPNQAVATPVTAATIEPTPDPTVKPPVPGAGRAWIAPSSRNASLGESFTLSVHVNTGDQAIAAYGFTITYDAVLLEVDKTSSEDEDKNGVDAESTGFISAWNVGKAGTIVVTGFDAGGKAPSTDLPIVKIYFKAKAAGTANIGLAVTTLVDVSTDIIGDPNGVPGSVTIQ